MYLGRPPEEKNQLPVRGYLDIIHHQEQVQRVDTGDIYSNGSLIDTQLRNVQCSNMEVVAV